MRRYSLFTILQRDRGSVVQTTDGSWVRRRPGYSKAYVMKPDFMGIDPRGTMCEVTLEIHNYI